MAAKVVNPFVPSCHCFFAGRFGFRTPVWPVQDFINMLPYPEYVRPDGALNLAAYYPAADGSRPDLGPKSYIANGR
jgi:hypothetical protein